MTEGQEKGWWRRGEKEGVYELSSLQKRELVFFGIDLKR
jgi:hypothetical protein